MNSAPCLESYIQSLFGMLHTESEFKSGLIIEQRLLLHSHFDDFCHKD